MSQHTMILSRIKETIQVLVEEIGPRASTSTAEQRASSYVAEQLRALGYDVFVERFRSVTSFSWTFGCFFLSFLVAAGLFRIMPFVSAMLCVLALIAFSLESNAIETLSRLMPQRLSQNVIGRLTVPAPALPAAGQGHARQTIVLSAHVDSARSALLWHPRIVGAFRALLLLSIAAMVAVTMLYILGLLVSARARETLWLVSLLPAAYLAAIVLILVHRELFGQVTPGANDNASGVAALLAVAEALVRDPLTRTDVWVVATGCEEAGTVGMLRFLNRHHFDRQSTWFLNFDNVGAGHITYIVAEGILLDLPADLLLRSLAARFAREHAELAIGMRRYKALTTDAIIPLVRRYRAMSIMAFDDRGRLPNWHWPGDTVAHLDFTTIATAAQMGAYLARELDCLGGSAGVQSG